MIKCEVPGCNREFKTKSGYASHLRAHKRKGDVTPEQARERKMRALASELSFWKKQAKRYEVEASMVDRICEVIRTAVDPLPEVKKPVAVEKEKGKRDETVVLFLSDTHIGKLTPSYNFDVFGERLEKLQISMMSIVYALRSIRPLKKLVIVFGGDIVDGESLYPGQIEKIQEHVLSQIYRSGVPEFQRFLWFCLENFEEVEIHAVRGNHGKQTGRSKWTASKSTNWDFFFYHTLKIAIGEQPRLTWNIYDKDWKAKFKIYDWGFLACHGDMIRRYYNLPHYGMSRQATRWQATYRDELKLHYFLYGHFHSSAAGWRFNQAVMFNNGSFVTDDEFAEEQLGVGSTPEQLMFGVHPEHGVSWRYVINLE